MKGSRKIVIYELHNGALIISSTKVGKNGKFVQNTEKGLGKAFSGNISNEELGKMVKKYIQHSEWSVKKENF